MQLVHSTQNKIDYVLTTPSGATYPAQKVKGGFIAGELFQNTMKALKEALWVHLPEAEKVEPEPAARRWTIQDWVNRCGISHSGKYVLMKEARRIFPAFYQDSTGLAEFLTRRCFELDAENAESTYRRWLAIWWLEQNPTFGAYDRAAYEERVAYLNRRDAANPRG
jgi:hypothetical protein